MFIEIYLHEHSIKIKDGFTRHKGMVLKLDFALYKTMQAKTYVSKLKVY